MPGAGGLDVAEDPFEPALDVDVKTAFYGATLGEMAPVRGQGLRDLHRPPPPRSWVRRSSPLYSLTKGALTSFTWCQCPAWLAS